MKKIVTLINTGKVSVLMLMAAVAILTGCVKASDNPEPVKPKEEVIVKPGLYTVKQYETKVDTGWQKRDYTQDEGPKQALSINDATDNYSYQMQQASGLFGGKWSVTNGVLTLTNGNTGIFLSGNVVHSAVNDRIVVFTTTFTRYTLERQNN